MHESIFISMLFIITCVGSGAINIGEAVKSFKSEKYIKFGYHVMATIMFVICIIMYAIKGVCL